MMVHDVIMPSSNGTQVRVLDSGEVLYQGTVGHLVAASCWWEDLEWRRVRLICCEGDWLVIELKPPISQPVRDFFYALFLVLLGLLFGWSMQGVWF